jgi:type I restriction enzyme, S subunit
LGDVPEHWEEKRVKDIATLERGKFTHRPRNDPQMYDGVHPFIQTGDVARAIKYITVYKQTLSDRGTTVSKQFKKGILVMAIAANIGDVAIVDFDTYFPDSIVAYKPKNNDTDYLFYLFSATRHELDKVKVTSTQDNLNLERLNSLIRFIPPLSEQKLIAHYLDTKTAQIDRKIDLFTQKATQYGNLKQSLINETVARGLDKSVPMKDSAIEWIGEVPEHWGVK